MKLIGKDGLSRFLEIALWVLMAIVVVLLLALPWSITRITGRIPGDPYYIKYLVILAYSGVMAELVLWQCRGMVRNINAGKVFTADTVRRLRVAAVELMVLAGFYGATMFWMSKFFMAFLFIVFVLGGCLLLVLAEVFRLANQYKEENDMTI
ncbi:MAG: DUF2975 domain-containing protein [Clostridia bacterium]|nr:DUF2975 domain-containing protein [Clostridia bacterium]